MIADTALLFLLEINTAIVDLYRTEFDSSGRPGCPSSPSSPPKPRGIETGAGNGVVGVGKAQNWV